MQLFSSFYCGTKILPSTCYWPKMYFQLRDFDEISLKTTLNLIIKHDRMFCVKKVYFVDIFVVMDNHRLCKNIFHGKLKWNETSRLSIRSLFTIRCP